MHLVCNLICNLINMLNTIVDRGPPMEHLGPSNPSPEAFAEWLYGRDRRRIYARIYALFTSVKL